MPPLFQGLFDIGICWRIVLRQLEDAGIELNHHTAGTCSPAFEVLNELAHPRALRRSPKVSLIGLVGVLLYFDCSSPLQKLVDERAMITLACRGSFAMEFPELCTQSGIPVALPPFAGTLFDLPVVFIVVGIIGPPGSIHLTLQAADFRCLHVHIRSNQFDARFLRMEVGYLVWTRIYAHHLGHWSVVVARRGYPFHAKLHIPDAWGVRGPNLRSGPP